MSKKKKSKSISILKEVDKSLTGTYENLIREIEDMQLKLNYADQLARKKAKKLSKKKNNSVKYEDLRKEVRMEVIGKMESDNFIERAMNFLNEIAPIIVIVARMIASLVLAILSLDCVKINIKPETLVMLNNLFNKAMAVH